MTAPKPGPPPQRGERSRFNEVFTAYARANTRAELIEQMTKAAADYFGGPAELRDMHIQPGPNPLERYQANSRWIAAP